GHRGQEGDVKSAPEKALGHGSLAVLREKTPCGRGTWNRRSPRSPGRSVILPPEAFPHNHKAPAVTGAARLVVTRFIGSGSRLAHHLRALGVRRGSFVAFLLPRGIDALVALLAALKAGAAYVPLDPDYPAERVGTILSDCGAAAVITTQALAHRCGAHGARAV